MNKEDLIKGKYYYFDNTYHKYIFIFNELLNTIISSKNYLGTNNDNRSDLKEYVINCNNLVDFKYGNNLRLATPEEKHWLNECIELNKFISKEEAMKSFYPKYYKYIGQKSTESFIKNKIYKIVNPINLEDSYNFIGENNVTNGWEYRNYEKFTPSTKEEYDAQFVVKEPIKTTFKPNDWVRVLSTGFNVRGNKVFEQFKKYVLKEEELKQPDTNAPIEEILEYCKKKYPAGTKVKSRINNNNIFTIIATPFILKDNIVSYHECGSVFLFKKSQTIRYSEIVKPVKQESFREVKVQLESRVYSLEELTKALTKEYDKVDVEDILKVIKQIK